MNAGRDAGAAIETTLLVIQSLKIYLFMIITKIYLCVSNGVNKTLQGGDGKVCRGRNLPGKKYTAHILYTASEIAKNTAHKTHASKKVQHNVCVHDKYPQNHLSLQKHKSGGHRRGKGGGG